MPQFAKVNTQKMFFLLSIVWKIRKGKLSNSEILWKDLLIWQQIFQLKSSKHLNFWRRKQIVSILVYAKLRAVTTHYMRVQIMWVPCQKHERWPFCRGGGVDVNVTLRRAGRLVLLLTFRVISATGNHGTFSHSCSHLVQNLDITMSASVTVTPILHGQMTVDHLDDQWNCNFASFFFC